MGCWQGAEERETGLVFDPPGNRVFIIFFKLGQTRGKTPTTVLTLTEKLTGCKAKGEASTAAKKKPKKRRLWGDGKGRFQTKGKHSAATVVGTKWLVEDRCTSTLTRVARAAVSVHDFVKKKTVLVKKGQKYVARARRPCESRRLLPIAGALAALAFPAAASGVTIADAIRRSRGRDVQPGRELLAASGGRSRHSRPAGESDRVGGRQLTN